MDRHVLVNVRSNQIRRVCCNEFSTYHCRARRQSDCWEWSSFYAGETIQDSEITVSSLGIVYVVCGIWHAEVPILINKK